jgi:hypothetical protein
MGITDKEVSQKTLTIPTLFDIEPPVVSGGYQDIALRDKSVQSLTSGGYHTGPAGELSVPPGRVRLLRTGNCRQ